ncbi:putative membrane protein [Porphyromonas crevioricanis JCM 15906]|uniref:Transporter n=2 Tax=Porphyromonas crevioricanis TaxID=393921 RepID=A0A2X4PLF1_9PORP|nr:putative transporter [Porphyromonas crevioricanis]KGN96391.1 transporter [Porphyromonas crevioricanis]SJZ86579.1 AspT/YidE/YbjL antiporter duplication domain-containing protein [Porphyromonas crevioricanis]SQH73195.1 putative transporter [Porphyromonas crevioricanis]GAD05313.1 putative membrane protein [Porphyromonas crevioricanis JCM 15906]GAD08219.1 putative membrane protein [Porphyromonas crevioricanis JCM 13913]
MIVDWFREQFLSPSITQTVIVLSLVSALGLVLGKIKLGRVSLGITFVFFIGIVFSYFGYKYIPGFGLHADMVSFAQSFGLVLFIYMLGLEVGPSFFPSLKSGGIAYNILGLAMVALTLFLMLVIHWVLPDTLMSMTDIIGVMSGAVTNTPILGAAQTTLAEVAGNSPTLGSDLAAMAQGCAVAYPMGVVGVILVLGIMAAFRKQNRQSGGHEQRKAFFSEFGVTNPAICGKRVQDIVHLVDRRFVISRIWHEGEVHIANSETVVSAGDHLLVVSAEDDVPVLEAFFGKLHREKDWNRSDIDWNAVDKELLSKGVIVTKSELNGVKLGSLRLRNLYDINITRIDRAGIELLPSPELHLQLGDCLTVVGERTAITEVASILGDQVKRLDKPNLISFFFGILLGCLVGMIPLYLPGVSMPIKLGLAGGPVIVGILMGAFGPRYRMATYVTSSANQMMKQLGIVLYLAGLGLMSGQGFFDVLFTSTGLTWLVSGILLTVVPALLIGLMAMRIFKVDFGASAGMVCGAMANPMALDYADSQVSDDSPSVVYATVYPLLMFVRIITAQIFVMFFV